MAVTWDDLGRAVRKQCIKGQVTIIHHFGIKCIQNFFTLGLLPCRGGELVCLYDPKSYASWGFVPGWSYHAGLVKGEKPDKGQLLTLRLGVWHGSNYLTV